MPLTDSVKGDISGALPQGPVADWLCELQFWGLCRRAVPQTGSAICRFFGAVLLTSLVKGNLLGAVL